MTNIFNEIYLINDSVNTEFSSLKLEERLFVYYMFRANLPFNVIAADQMGLYHNEIINLFEFFYKHREEIEENLFQDIKTYLVYLWVNHGVYFLREGINNKRTPNKLGMKYLTRTSFEELIQRLGYKGKYLHLLDVIFDETFKPSLVVEGDIDKSGNNFYGPGFTNDHYDQLDLSDKGRINAYPSLDADGRPIVSYYGIGQKYSKELVVASYWLTRALECAKNNPETFDQHIAKSLEYLIEYLVVGDEEKFKQHSIEWLKTKSRLDYTLGFIETYHDPKSKRGDAGGDITVKVANMERLNPILLDIETRLPLPEEYRRTISSGTTMNISLNKILFSSGHYGPVIKTAAYCLPNYHDIRAEHGSKQIIYKLPTGLESKLNPELAKQFRSSLKRDFSEQLFNDLWDVQVILHETVGHASGKLYQHTFVEGDNLTVGGKTYSVGDTVEVTKDNVVEFLGKDSSALEELRAEINALYMSVTEIDLLSEQGLFKSWKEVLGVAELQKQCIIRMASSAFTRYLTLKDNFTEIVGAHVKANVVIANYLLEGGGIRIVDEVKEIEGHSYHMLDLEVIDYAQAFKSIVALLQMVQQIKSTGDGIGCRALFEKYTQSPITIEQANKYRNYLVTNKQKLVGNIKECARIYPNYLSVTHNSEIIDVIIGPELDIFEQNMYYKKLTYSLQG